MSFSPQRQAWEWKARWYWFRLAERFVLTMLIPVWRVLWHRRRRYGNKLSSIIEILPFRHQYLGFTKKNQVLPRM